MSDIKSKATGVLGSRKFSPQIKIRKVGCLYGNDTPSRRVYQARHGMCPSLMSREYKDPVKIIVYESRNNDQKDRQFVRQ